MSGHGKRYVYQPITRQHILECTCGEWEYAMPQESDEVLAIIAHIDHAVAASDAARDRHARSREGAV